MMYVFLILGFLLLIKGAVPGPKGSVLVIKDSVKA